MSSTPTAAHLRLVASALRSLASQLSDVPLAAARSLASADTWLGPTPHECAQALWHHQRMLSWHSQELSASARRLEREADRLDQMSAAPAGMR
ncbi:MAG: hypothetical protein WCI22_03760 [Actinomycetota bacterium]